MKRVAYRIGDEMLTVEEMNRITKEVTLDMLPSLTSKEATTFREEIKRKGRVVELPAD